jgi:hypothetical protein
LDESLVNHLQQSQTFGRNFSHFSYAKQFDKAGVYHFGLHQENSMKTYAIEHLRDSIDEAIGCAEQAGLAFVVLLLDMARLEVDQTTDDRSNIVPITSALGKRP